VTDSKPRKHRLFIVGGKGRNVPPWLSAAFDYEQFEQDHAKTRTLEPSVRPDAVVVLSSWVGHEHFYGARDLAGRLSIPMILSPGGWSTSLKAAADLGIEWFIKDIERARTSGGLPTPTVEALDEFVDNAWREAYNREWAAREALTQRYAKERKRSERLEAELTKLKVTEAAAQRVIAEIRAAAALQRAEMERHNEEVQHRSARVADALAEHMNTMKELFESVDETHAMLVKTTSHVHGVRNDAQRKMDFLRAALKVAEEGTPSRIVATESPISASNLEMGS